VRCSLRFDPCEARAGHPTGYGGVTFLVKFQEMKFISLLAFIFEAATKAEAFGTSTRLLYPFDITHNAAGVFLYLLCDYNRLMLYRPRCSQTIPLCNPWHTGRHSVHCRYLPPICAKGGNAMIHQESSGSSLYTTIFGPRLSLCRSCRHQMKKGSVSNLWLPPEHIHARGFFVSALVKSLFLVLGAVFPFHKCASANAAPTSRSAQRGLEVVETGKRLANVFKVNRPIFLNLPSRPFSCSLVVVPSFAPWIACFFPTHREVPPWVDVWNLAKRRYLLPSPLLLDA
jgi:hypothetical protein